MTRFGRAVRDITAQSGTQTNCAGIAKIIADIEPAEGFEFVDAHDGRWIGHCDDEIIDWCVAAVRRGVIEELTRAGDGQLPAVRFILRRIQVHPVDSAEFRNVAVGRMAIAEALHQLGMAT